MADFNDETNDLIDNAAADLINASAKEQADEIRSETQGSIDTENSALQQNTSALNANTQAQKALNDEKQKTLTIQQALDKAVQESLKQKNEMLVYQGSGANFNRVSNNFINSGEGSQTFGVGHYFTNAEHIARDYASRAPYNNDYLRNSSQLDILKTGVSQDVVNYKNELDSLKSKIEHYKKEIEVDSHILKDFEGDDLTDDEKEFVERYKAGIKHYSEIINNLTDRYIKVETLLNNVTDGMSVESISKNGNDIVKQMFYTAAIPKDDGKNYFDWNKQYNIDDLINEAVNNEVEKILISLKNNNDLRELSGGDFYNTLKHDLLSDQEGATNAISGMGYKGIKYPAGLIYGGSKDGDTNYVVFNEDDVRIIKKEDLLGVEKSKYIERDLYKDTSLYNPVTYVDESLKSAIEGSSFDGTKFILDIAEAIKQKIIPADGAKLASGSFVIGPDLENFTAQKVNDLILTNDGRAYITDKADNIIATKDLGSLGEGEQKVRLEGSREPIGILSNEDAVTFKTLADAIESLTSKKNILIESASALKGQEYQKNASNIDNLSVQIGKIENTKDKRLQIAADNLFKANEDYLENWFDNLADNFEKADKAEKEFADTLERVETYRKNEKDNEEKFNNTMFGGADDIRFRQTRGLLSEFYGYQSSINGMNGNSLGISTEEQKIQDEYTSSKKEIDSMVSSLNEYKSIILRLNEAINDTTISDERKLMYTQELGDVSVGYNSTLQRLNATLKEANERTSEAVYENNLKNADSGYSRRKASIDAKYAWRRDRLQTNLLLNEGYLNNYNTTGSLRESFQKTLFNRANGFRQRQGLTGFASNLGYNTSGVGLSLGLGTFAKGIEKATKAVLNFAEGSVAAYGELQSIKTNLGIVYSSQAQADQTFSEIAAYAVKSPFGVQTVSEYAVLLKQSGIYASDLMDTLKQIGDVAGGNQQKFANIANAFSQIEANGKATTRQLRQFATAGIPIYKELASQLGVGIEQIRKMTEEGKISASVIEEAFANLTGHGGIFENAVNIGAKTWKARQQNLADAKQLAQAQVGQFIIEFGGTGRNDSIAENILSIRENILNSVGDWAELKNIQKSVKNIETQESIVKKLQAEYDLLEAQGASPETLRRKKEEINSAAMYKSPDLQRAAAESLYNLYKDDLNKRIVNDYEYDDLVRKSKGYNISDVLDSTSEAEYGSKEYYNNMDKLNTAIVERADAETMLTNVIKQSEYDRKQKELEPYMSKVNTSKVLRTFSKGYEDLDKIINKDTKNIYSAYQKGVQSYEQSSKGRQEIRDKELQAQNDAQQAWDRGIQLIDENGRLSDSFNGTIQDAVELFNSGIITPLEEISFSPENLASDFTYNLAEDSKKATEQLLKKRSDFNYVLDNITGNISGLLNADDISKDAKNKLKNFSDSLFNKVNVYGQERNAGYIENTQENLDVITEDFNSLLEWLDSSGNGSIAEILAKSATKFKVTDRPGDINLDDKDKQNDIYPLWQRILNQNLGTDLTLFKKGAITNGRQAVELFDRQSQKEQIKNIARTMLDYNNTSFMSNLITRGNQTYTENNSRDGTRTINWTKTYQNFTDFARSMESATAVTQAYAQSLESETNSLKDLLSNSFTTMEDSANIFDENYQKMIGDTANSIKALDMNAYDNLFEEIRTSEGTFIKFRENAIEAANALLKEKEVTLTFVEAIGTFKSAIDDMTKQIANSTIEMQVYTGQYSKYKTLSGLDNENQIKALQFISSALSTDKMNQYFNGNGFSRDYVTKALLSGTPISISNNNEAELENLKARKSKLEESISELLETAINNTIEIENKKFEDKTGGEAWKDVYGKEDESKKLAQKWVEEGVDSRAGKAYTTAKDELALITEQVDVLSNSSVNLFDELNESFVKYLEYLKQEKDIIESAANSKVFGELWNKDLTNTDDTLSFKSIYNTRQRDNVFGSNTIQEQRFITENFNDETLQFDKVFSSVFKRGTEDYNEIVKEMLRNTTGEEYEGLSEIRQKLDKDFARTGTFDINNVKEYVLGLNDIEKAVKGINDTFIDLEKSISDAFDTAILSGFTETAKQLGANLYEIKQNTFDSEAAAKSYQNVWKGIAAQMLESIGPAMTQAGLDLISLGARKDSWGTILAGAGLVTAGGVAQIGAGFLSAAQNDNSDNDDETQKLETLKELLSDIIDQAKTDAEYYQKNLLHKNAISMNERTSVNDAIITPSGDVITTHPDDYLIATKTPGSLASSSPNVSIKFIDQSQGGKVQIKETHQTRDANGNIEIKAIVVAAMNEAIANGDADVAFEARDMRLNGRSVIL